MVDSYGNFFQKKLNPASVLIQEKSSGQAEDFSFK